MLDESYDGGGITVSGPGVGQDAPGDRQHSTVEDDPEGEDFPSQAASAIQNESDCLVADESEGDSDEMGREDQTG
jgi:hypothetical protein